MAIDTLAPKTIQTYPIVGLDYTIPFEYLARKFIVVTLIGEAGREVLLLNTDYRFTTPTQITLNVAPSGDYTEIEIRRNTSATDRLVDFNDGSILRAFDLNVSAVQTLHVAEEARDLAGSSMTVNDDGNLDARGRRIINVKAGIEAADAVNFGQLVEFDDSTKNNADRAEAAAAAAELSETNAKNSEDSTKKDAASANSSASTANTAAMDARKSYEAIVPLEESVTTLAPQVEANAIKAEAAADKAQEISDNLGDLSGLPPRVDALDKTTTVPVNILGEVGTGFFTRVGYTVHFRWVSFNKVVVSTSEVLCSIPEGYQPVESCVGSEFPTNRANKVDSSLLVTCVVGADNITMYNAGDEAEFYRVTMTWFTKDI